MLSGFLYATHVTFLSIQAPFLRDQNISAFFIAYAFQNAQYGAVQCGHRETVMRSLSGLWQNQPGHLNHPDMRLILFGSSYKLQNNGIFKMQVTFTL